MQAWAFITWWYGAGWVNEARIQVGRLSRVESYFAFGTLFRTLFQPFRQIDAESRRRDLSGQFRGLLDRTISRFIGASARLVLILAGGLWWCVSALMGVCWLVIWPLLPFAPLIGGIAAAAGVGSV